MQAIGSITSWVGGIADSEKEGQQGSFAFGAGIDFRSDSKKISVNPRAQKDSGNIVTDLVMWGERVCSATYFIGNTGKIYRRGNTTGTWSHVHTAADSVGNGLGYFGEDDNLYYAQNTTLGRYTQACDELGEWIDGFLEAQGGEPTNTRSLDFERSSSEYAYKADTAALSMTGDMSLETYIKPESLPGEGEIQVLMAKWNEQSNQRSYRFDIKPTSNFFGDGNDGALTISTDTTHDPIDANIAGTVGAYTATVTNEHASFSASIVGERVLIHQSRGSGTPGAYQFNKVLAYSGGVVTFEEPLNFSYSTTDSTSDDQAQIIMLHQYTDITVDAGVTWTAKAWDGRKGGILMELANGTLTINGNIYARGKEVQAFQTLYGAGFRGGATSTGSNTTGEQGESYNGEGTRTTSRNDGAGGGGSPNKGGGGAAHAQDGTSGNNGQAGAKYGSSTLSVLLFGSGGGSGGCVSTSSGNAGTAGAGGGGILGLLAATIVMGANGYVSVQGGDVYPPGTGAGDDEYPGAGASAGSILVMTQTATLGTDQFNAQGGNGFVRRTTPSIYSGDGADGYITVYYNTSYTGTITTPNATFIQDDSLGSADGYILRLGLSSNGTLEEFATVDITDLINTTDWARWQVSYKASTGTVKFYRSGVPLATRTLTTTSIYDSTANFVLGANQDDSGSYENFYDGLMDDARVWNDVRTDSEFLTQCNKVLTGFESNMIAYFEFEEDLTDSEDNGSHDLTHSGTAVYSEDVPFSGVTTRLDEDLSYDASTNVYTTPTAIDEGATHRLSIVPTKDPQKSIAFDINDKGTGDWTITVHNALNQVQATVTVANADLFTGNYEFIFDEVWRPVLGQTYHVHVTSTVNDGEIVADTTSDLETSDFRTYYQILVEDEYHPILQYQNLQVIGNERYLAVLEGGDLYEPHKLTLPAGYRIRSLSIWRQYLAIGVWRGEEITDYDFGYIFFWDGVSDTYNFFVPVPEGGINALLGSKGVLWAMAGYKGDLMAYLGGDTARKMKRLPRVGKGKKNYMEVAPGGMTMWQALMHIGVALNSDSTTLERGVYTYGLLDEDDPISLGFDQPLSLGRQTGVNVKVGGTIAVGQSLFMGWQNGTQFGVDRVHPDNDPYENSSVELLISDIGAISMQKRPLAVRIDFTELQTGESVTVRYKKDRADDYNSGIIEDTEGAKFVTIPIGEELREIQARLDIKALSGTAPDILGATLEVDNAENTRRA